jgi:small-conductance mechanosensitive channel
VHLIGNIVSNWRAFALGAGLLLGAVGAGQLLHWVLYLIVKAALRRKEQVVLRSAASHLKRPLRLGLPLLFIAAVTPFLKLSSPAGEVFRQILGVLAIAAISWMLIKAAGILEDYLLQRYNLSEKDNLRARQIYTQFHYLRRVFAGIVAILAVALVLVNFNKVRQLGTTLLASAGIVGAVLGFASQRSISLLLAGLQVTATQPIRIDDVLVIQGEWGRVEEISLTFVVLRIWDERRLIIPMSYFLENPFQNWTRVSAELLGTVYIYADYTVPVQPLREELGRILEASPSWDRRVNVLQVTDVTDKTVELRALMSAVDSSTLWNLRCEVREKLISFLQREYPQALAKVRADIGGPAAAPSRP